MNWTPLQNSLLVTALSAAGAMVIGLLAALCVAGLGEKVRRWIIAPALVALALPPFLVTSCWLHLLGSTGVWREWLPLNIYSLGGTVWILILLTWPITLLFVTADWRRLSQSQLESDPALRGWRLIRWLLLPVGRSGLLQAGLLTVVLTLNNFAVPAILQTKVFPAEIWVSFNTSLDYLEALRLGWPLLVAPLLVLVWLVKRDTEWTGFEDGVLPGAFRRKLGIVWFAISSVTTALVLLLSVGLPLKDVIFSDRTWREFYTAASAGWGAVGNSLLFSLLGATSCVALGLWAWKRSWPVLFALTLFIPGVLLGMGLSFTLNRPALRVVYQSIAIVMIALVARYLLIGWKGARHALRSVDPDLTATARVNDHASRGQLLRFVHWPQIGAQLAAVWYVIYLLCLWDVESLILVIPPGRETLAMRVFNLLHYGHNTQVNALCLILLGLALIPWLAWQFSRWTYLRVQRASVLLGGVLILASLSACDQHPSNEAAINSKLFSKVQIIGSMGTGVGQFNKPRSLAVDAQDNLYVVDMTGRVQKFSPTGAFVTSWQMPQTDKGKPKGMCRDRNGDIIVVEPHYARVNHFSTEGKMVTQWGVHGTNGGQLSLPRAVAVNSKGDLYVAEYTQAERVQKFSAKGQQFLLQFGRSGAAKGEFNRPEGLAVDAKDRVYVADSCNHRIQIFSPDGQFLASYGRAGSGPGELSYPYDIQVDGAGRQYVCEFGNSRVQVFDAQNQPIETIGTMGFEPAQFSNPWSLALDSKGNLYVADSRNHRVQKFIRRPEHRLVGDWTNPSGKT